VPRARSDGIGRGATFTVELPLDRRRAPRREARAAPVAPAAHRVLLIEDNVDAATMLKEALQLEGHTVEVAYTGPEGVEAARTFRPAVVLCDLGLPGMDGFQVARRIRSHPGLSEVHLVALSGYTQAEDVERAREAGFDLHVAKPPNLEVLWRTLASWPAEPATGA
jgi:CheY-like chemotaxis protein